MFLFMYTQLAYELTITYIRRPHVHPPDALLRKEHVNMLTFLIQFSRKMSRVDDIVRMNTEPQ